MASVCSSTAQIPDKNFTPPIENADQEKPEEVDNKKQLPDENSGDQIKPEKKTAIKNPGTKSDETTYPEIRRDLASLPFPVRRMRELILEVALSGDIEKLRPLIGYGDDVTMLSLGGIEEDPLIFLKSLAGDENGHEILAILAEVLETGYVLMDEGTNRELYVWPYFFAWPLDKLTPRQKVELYRLITHGDYEDMESFGAYIFYRLGITPRGRWRFFVAGD
ncbi:MAG: hypothetical protein GY761_02605 [Hyphomicrobiales bacterium]|nr:hypothetical protein [Hyphomicrobiales bacterium]